MQFSADFYRRRFEAKLAANDGELAPPPAIWFQTEAEVLAVPSDPEFIREAYRFYLKRDPDLGGLLYFCEMAEKQGRQATVVAPQPGERSEPGDTLELTELLSIADDHAFVTAAYERVLGRGPDHDGLEHHLDQLRQGATRATLLQGLAASPGSAGARSAIHLERPAVARRDAPRARACGDSQRTAQCGSTSATRQP